MPPPSVRTLLAFLSATIFAVAAYNIYAFHSNNGSDTRSNVHFPREFGWMMMSDAKAPWLRMEAKLPPPPLPGEAEKKKKEKEKNDNNDLPTPEEEKKKKTVYTCGWDQGKLAEYLFPDYAFVGRLDENVRGTPPPTFVPPNETSVLVYGKHGPCKGVPRKGADIAFPGATLVIDGESSPMFKGTFSGHPKPRRFGSTAMRGNFGPTSLIGHYDPAQWEAMTDPTKKAVNTGERYLMYLVSRCNDIREEAFDRLSLVGRSPAYYGGKCRGLAAKEKANTNITALPAPQGEVPPRLAGKADGVPPWRDNYLVFRPYRFCLVMENKQKRGYITEKIINAFLGGCVPIYFGTDEIYDIFNPKAFVFYDPQEPQRALDRVSYLERNESAYREVLREPILRHGERTVEEHFSYADEVGGGKQKRRIREMLGIFDR